MADGNVPESAPACGRKHVVLIPGFAGFDALGQLEYYAGVTPVFRDWTSKNKHAGLVLHYFDNFPTAAVVTRAARLQRYIAKRVARGEILPEDCLILIGHSTGGLDIRRLIWDLAHPSEEKIAVDGNRQSAYTVEAADILKLVRGVVFLSVPHWGTNIADWVRAHATARKLVVSELRAAVWGSQLPLLDTVEGWIGNCTARLWGVDLLRAVQDALNEAREHTGKPGPTRVAEAQEAAAQLELWLRHMASDFSVINDLASHAPVGDTESPAHFLCNRRYEELQLWKEKPIETMSYLTVGRRPFKFDQGKAAPVWDVLKPWTSPEWTKEDAMAAGTDIAYRICYRACAGGPFNQTLPGDLPGLKRPSAFQGQQVEVWDNDGIVNTASMFWPAGENVLVCADHMDIVGHYKLAEAVPGTGRKYQAYDLLASASGFGDANFVQVWNDIFEFCASIGRTHPAPFAAAAP